MRNNRSSIVQKNILAPLRNNPITIFFVCLAIFLAVLSGNSFESILADTSSRFFRNLLLILALIFPIMAGIGLNFGIVLGAMSAQLALIFLTAFNLSNNSFSLILWIMLSTIIAIITGSLLALLFNKTKGSEMISGLLVGFFANGIYMFILMVILGGIIPLTNPMLVISTGAPVKATVNLTDALNGAVDNVWKVPYYYIIVIAAIVALVIIAINVFRKRTKPKTGRNVLLEAIIYGAIGIGLLVFCLANKSVAKAFNNTQMPVVTCVVCIVIMLFVNRVMRSKLGHDFTSVRNDIAISASIGINVNKTRTLSVILSTVIAALAQIVYIQNLGALNTYQMHANIATYAIAALLIGGATVRNATIKNAVLGCVLFQIIYGNAPNATKNLLDNAQLGEYFRIFLCYGIITVAIVSYAIRERKIASQKIDRGS